MGLARAAAIRPISQGSPVTAMGRNMSWDLPVTPRKTVATAPPAINPHLIHFARFEGLAVANQRASPMTSASKAIPRTT